MDTKMYKKAIDADIAAYINYLHKTHTHPDLQVFTAALQKDAPRLTGMLTMAGYEMCGGANKKMIIQAARAMEMLGVYVELLPHQPVTAALGNHAAHTILANLEVEPLLRSNTISITNRSLLIILQDRDGTEAKAHFNFVNPLHVGMVLAGVGCPATDAITPFAQHFGQAFYLPKSQAAQQVEQALSALRAGQFNWTATGTQFLTILASQLLTT